MHSITPLFLNNNIISEKINHHSYKKCLQKLTLMIWGIYFNKVVQMVDTNTLKERMDESGTSIMSISKKMECTLFAWRVTAISDSVEIMTLLKKH